ncbi:MAG: amino acid--tRNA ligase-related protein [Saprospiraceae bacterium]
MLRPPKSWNFNTHFDHAVEHDWYRLVNLLKANIYFLTNDFYKSKKFFPALLPITCSAVSSPMGLGSDSLPVKIKLFGEETFLADSMQFHLEYMLRQGMPGVFYIMQSFRGEMHDERHLNQFIHSEAEIFGGYEDVLQLVEDYLLYLILGLVRELADRLEEEIGDISHIYGVLEMLKNNKVPRITFEEATQILGNDNVYYSDHGDGIRSLTPLGEKELLSKFPVLWLTHPDRRSVPFYQAYDPDGFSSKSADLLLGIGEIVGCGERHRGHEETLFALKEHNVSVEEYAWYLDMKRKYPIQTAGFGLGVERLILWLLKHDDIRDIPFINRLKGTINVP